MAARRMTSLSALCTAGSLGWAPLVLAGVVRSVERPDQTTPIALGLGAGAIVLLVLSATLSAVGAGPGPLVDAGEPPVERALRALRLGLGWAAIIAALTAPLAWVRWLLGDDHQGLLHASLWAAVALSHAGLSVIANNALGGPDPSPVGEARAPTIHRAAS